MATIAHLLEEIVTAIIEHITSIYECIHLLMTCRTFWNLTHSRALWVHLLKCAQARRPVPISGPVHELSTKDLQGSIVKAMRLDHMLSKKKMPEPIRIWSLDPPPGTIGFHTTGELWWAWLVKDGIHLLSMFVRGTIQIWNLHGKRIVSTFNIGGYPLRWNHSVDKNGFTIIFYSSSIGKTFQVWRYDYRTGRSKQMHERELEGNLPFIWIEGELAGYVATTDDDMLFVYAFSMVTLSEVGVSTTMKSPPNLSIFSSPNHLYLYSEESSSAFYEFYELEWLKARLHAPIEIITAPPQFHRDFEFKGRQLVSDNRWYSMCSRLWDGRYGVFSRSYRDETRGSTYISLAIVDEDASSNECHSLTVYLAHWLRDHEIAQSISGAEMFALEGFGKTLVWMEERSEGLEEPALVGLFSEFPPSGTIPPLSKVEKQPLDVSHIDRGQVNSAMEQSLSGAGDTSWESMPPSQAVGPVTFGKICEYTLPGDWVSNCGSAYAIDFDDARGRLAFVTGDGEITILEFV